MDWSDFLSLARTALGTGDPAVTVAVLDGSVDTAHPCFAGARLELVATPADGGGATAHGTHVASLLFGQPGSGMEGLAPGCRGLIVPVFGGEQPACSQLDLARAILLAVDRGADIINISSGQPSSDGEPEPILAQAIETCRRRNVLIVAAAGNDGCACLHVPAAARTVLAAGAMDADGQPLPTSNFGPAYRSQGLLAPGHDMPGALPGGGVTRRSGTSYAAPAVSGVAALLVGLQRRLGRTADPHGVRRVLLATAEPCRPGQEDDCSTALAGKINIRRAIDAITGGETMTTDTDMLVPSDAADNGAAPETTRRYDPTAFAARRPAAIARSELRPSDGGSMSPPEPPAPTGAGALAVTPSDCGCGCGGKKEGGCACGGRKEGGGCSCGGGRPQIVYAIGRLGIDFGSEARRDSYLQAMSVQPADSPIESPVPEHFGQQLLAYLDGYPYEAPGLIWTLNLDATPIYAIQPLGAYAEAAYDRLREALRAQINEGVELISVPGTIAGQVRLQSGQVVPLVVPAIRGLYSWATEPLVAHVLGAMPAAAADREVYERQAGGLANYLDRVYYDLRNLGITGEERALNYSATNAVQIASVIRSATSDQLDLDRIAVHKSPVCRPDSECYDVELSFFDPRNTNVASRVFRFTVDVSDVIPVTVGPVRSWTRRA
ncbi:MAG: PatA/PatG family cyanobactin maturation protease [Rhizobiaceae bacterium]|nr:MAG: PatA/PatG family cyanobactin maturation protease [Rhizobiaceae bacterium]CAG1008645.1 Major intracellular serine protease [Rhizobiaceae bacterium]